MTVAPAHANPRYAAYVIHADTGDVFFDRYSNERRYPASLTKMMTLYLLFEAIERGDVSLDDDLAVSRRASLQPASRLGLSAGSTIKVETAIEALVIRSANDVATVVAEHLGTSEGRFARRMTERAREMGMRSTTFRNASGLPDRNQVTTARDMAILSQRIIQDFPQHFAYFDQDSFTWNGRTYRSHNNVARDFDGADGLKTGYTRASGYNLATTVDRDGNRLIGIVLGGRRASTRDAHMRSILNDAYRDIRRRPHLVSAVHRFRPTPSLRPDREAAAEAIYADARARLPVPTLRPDRDMPEPVSVETLAALVDDEEPFGQGDAASPQRRDWVIQVGAFSDQPMAIGRIHATQSIVRTVADDPGREVNIAERGAQAVFRARFTRLTENEATQSCDRLLENGTECIAIQIPQDG